MASIKERITDDIKSAMRAQDKVKLEALRYISAALKQIEVDERISPIPDDRAISVLQKLVKQRHDSIEQFQKGNRPDLVAKEQSDLAMIQNYLPQAMSEAEVDQAIAAAMKEVNATVMQDMGKVMAILKNQLQGRADLSQVSMKVKQRLS